MAWRNVLAAAYPKERVPYRSILAAYVAGVGTNAIIPARAGDVLRLYLTHRAIPGATYTTLVSSTAVLAIVDMTLAGILFLWALTQGLLPSADSLPDLPGFDFGWLFGNPVAAQILFLVAVLVLIVRGRLGALQDRRLRAPHRPGVRGHAPAAALAAHASSRGSWATGRSASPRSGSSSARSGSTSRSATRCSCR